MRLSVVKYLKILRVTNMLLPDNLHPENSIYYNGSIILQVLKNEDKLEMFELYTRVKEMRDISFPVFVLCLDWLYLVDIAKVKRDRVELCF